MANLTSPNHWFCDYALDLSIKLGNIPVYDNHIDIIDTYDIFFILSDHKLVN